MRRSLSSSFFSVCASLVIGLSSFGAAHADEYSVVPQGDAILRNMSMVERTGWITSTRSASANNGATRYEIALQTAAAIFLVSARIEADTTWAQSVSPASLTALRDLAVSLRPELQKLGVNTQSFLQLLARASKTAPQSFPSAVASQPVSSNRNTLPVPARYRTRANSPSGNGGVALSLGRGFALRAGVGSTAADNSLERLALRESQLPLSNSKLDGGLEWTPLNGLTFSTNVENVTASAQGRASRFSSGVGISALDNRVSLVANFSRLKMENADDASTVAGVNLGVGVSSNVSLNLLYQQLFSTPTPTRSERVLAGGVSVKF